MPTKKVDALKMSNVYPQTAGKMYGIKAAAICHSFLYHTFKATLNHLHMLPINPDIVPYAFLFHIFQF